MGHSSAQRLAAQGDAEVQRLQTEVENTRLKEREQYAQAYAKHPALLRRLELETLNELARNANARIYIGFDTPTMMERREMIEGPPRMIPHCQL